MGNRNSTYTAMIDLRQGVIPGSDKAGAREAGGDMARLLKTMTRTEALDVLAAASGPTVSRRVRRAVSSAMRGCKRG